MSLYDYGHRDAADTASPRRSRSVPSRTTRASRRVRLVEGRGRGWPGSSDDRRPAETGSAGTWRSYYLPRASYRSPHECHAHRARRDPSADSPRDARSRFGEHRGAVFHRRRGGWGGARRCGPPGTSTSSARRSSARRRAGQTSRTSSSTHRHFDHVGGLDLSSAPALGRRSGPAPTIARSTSNDGRVVLAARGRRSMSTTFASIHTPGHTPGHRRACSTKPCRRSSSVTSSGARTAPLCSARPPSPPIQTAPGHRSRRWSTSGPNACFTRTAPRYP